MGRRCKAGGCSVSSDVHALPIHHWPVDKVQAASWKAFLKQTRSDSFDVNEGTSICALHFKADQFANLTEYITGSNKRLQLVRGAVPTITSLGVSKSPLYHLFDPNAGMFIKY